MSSKKTQHAKDEACTTGRIGYDGGFVDFTSHEMWVVCSSPDCKLDSCKGKYVELGREYGEDAFADVVRVRSVKDLKRHLGADSDLQAECLVAPKGTFGSSKPKRAMFFGNDVPAGVNRGRTSVKQAEKVNDFPVKARAKTFITSFLSRMSVKGVEDGAAFSRRKAQTAEDVRSLVKSHGVDAVANSISNQSTNHTALVVATADAELVDRSDGSRVRRDVKALKGKTPNVQPTKALLDLAPSPGTLAAGKMKVEVGRGQGHFVLRFLDRGLDALPRDVVDRANSGRAVAFSALDINLVREEVQRAVDNGAFTHSTTVGVADAEMRANVDRSTKIPTNRCEVRVAHPRDPKADLVIILQADRRDKEARDPRGNPKIVVQPITCLKVANGKARQSSVDTYADKNLHDEARRDLEKAVSSHLN